MEWQNWVAGLIVAVAACWILRESVRSIRRGLGKGAPGNPSCGSCAKNPATRREDTPLVQLGDETERRGATRARDRTTNVHDSRNRF